MASIWYYTHGGKVQGPVEAETLHQLAASGGLVPGDLIWLSGRSPSEAVPAEAALAFPITPAGPPAALPASLPDWVGDLARANAANTDLASLSAPPVESWIEDVRRAEEEARKSR
jgi:hypothetical protein